MTRPIEYYWDKRLAECKETLEKNNFEVLLANKLADVKELILTEILAKLEFTTVSWGDSESMLGTGIIEEIENMPDVNLIKTFEDGVEREEILERRRQALLADIFFTGSNALTECGKLVNLDMVGNRIAGLVFGPRYVILVIGRNKIVADVDAAMKRIKEYAAPLNAIRHPGWKTPCVKTAFCSDCKSPDRICNTWTITEKCYPKKRVKIVLVNEDLGL